MIKPTLSTKRHFTPSIPDSLHITNKPFIPQRIMLTTVFIAEDVTPTLHLGNDCAFEKEGVL